jgi:18S rRNA (adenine1779-N6/adenine1780-N6)-dimethyltransferase
MELLEDNYRTYCAQNNLPLDDGPPEEGAAEEMDVDEALDDEMDLEEEDELPALFKKAKSRSRTKKRKGRVYEMVKEKVRKVLKETDMAEKRARSCFESDFLRLLYAFNLEGIHFC